jgi:hypothetical protein
MSDFRSALRSAIREPRPQRQIASVVASATTIWTAVSAGIPVRMAQEWRRNGAGMALE